MSSEEDEKYMRRCIQLARNGQFGAPPNPMVGAVVVCNGKIIGEGYHVRCGQGHAEVNAIASVKNPELLPLSTIYVSLEPCSHYGKTPPCADLIISKHIKRVVVGCIDPFAKVQGRGIAKLRAAGVDVKVGVLEKECKMLNKRFITFHSLQRPYIILKWAQSADGFIAATPEKGKIFISTPQTLMYVHRLRTENEAILVGRKTAEIDNPKLTSRRWFGKDPLRIVLDSEARLAPELNLFDGSAETLVVSQKEYADKRANVSYFHPSQGEPVLPQLMKNLHERGVQSLLVEGGQEVLQNFIDADLWDEIKIEKGKIRISDGVSAPKTPADIKWKSEKHWGVEFCNAQRELL